MLEEMIVIGSAILLVLVAATIRHYFGPADGGHEP
jgi:hypothetical protein